MVHRYERDMGRNTESAILSPDEARTVFEPALAAHLQDVRATLRRLGVQAPQVLILEGGTEQERAAMAFWEAALLNCPHGGPEGPCLDCPVCLQIGALFYQDLFMLDGRKGHIPIAEVRSLRTALGEASHGAGRRVALLVEAQALGGEAANALLKSMEEPRPGVLFLMTTPQRARLLPTLVSRGWVLALPWPDSAVRDALEKEWLAALSGFLTDGQGWFGRTSRKNTLDAALARRVVVAVQKELAAAMRSERGARLSGVAEVFAAMSDVKRAYAVDVLAQCQNSLDYMVNPALVLDWMAVRLHLVARVARR